MGGRAEYEEIVQENGGEGEEKGEDRRLLKEHRDHAEKENETYRAEGKADKLREKRRSKGEEFY